MAAYHITPKGPRRCRAAVRDCPYAKAGGEHYSDPVEAQAAYDNVMADTFGTLAILKTTLGEKARQKSYQQTDKLMAQVAVLKATPAMAETAAVMFYLGQQVKRGVRAADEKLEAVEKEIAARYAERATLNKLKPKSHKATALEKRQLQIMKAAKACSITNITSKRVEDLKKGDRLPDGRLVANVFAYGNTRSVHFEDGQGNFLNRETIHNDYRMSTVAMGSTPAPMAMGGKHRTNVNPALARRVKPLDFKQRIIASTLFQLASPRRQRDAGKHRMVNTAHIQGVPTMKPAVLAEVKLSGATMHELSSLRNARNSAALAS